MTSYLNTSSLTVEQFEIETMAAALPYNSCHTYHGILSVSKFTTNPGAQDIQTELNQQIQSPLSKVKGTLGKELPNNLKCLMGNGVNITDADAAVQHLAHRNYPALFAPDGSKCGKIQICIPDIYLLGKKSVKFVNTSEKSVTVNTSLFSKEGELSNLGKLIGKRQSCGTDTTVEQIPEQCIQHDNELLGMHRNLSGDLIEKEFYKKIRQILESTNDEFALFQGHDLFKFDLNDRLNKLAEKDFIIVNNTHRYICGVEVKQTLSGSSISKSGKQLKGTISSSANQLKGTKASLESWFSLDLNKKWTFMPLVYCKELAPGITICNDCSPYVIRGSYS